MEILLKCSLSQFNRIEGIFLEDNIGEERDRELNDG